MTRFFERYKKICEARGRSRRHQETGRRDDCQNGPRPAFGVYRKGHGKAERKIKTPPKRGVSAW